MSKEQFIRIDESDTEFYYSDREMTILHREDGPAVGWTTGDKAWYLNDKFLTEEEFNVSVDKLKIKK